MILKHLVPWRVQHFIDQWFEKSVRPRYPSVYKLLKFGKININTPDYWDKVWRTDTVDREYEELFKVVLERIPTGAKVLDVGCGMGRLARLMRDRRGAEVTCLDFSAWACEQLAKEGFETVVSTLPKIPLPDNMFDIAVATEVLEHLDYPEKTLHQMVRVVKVGGAVMCSVPNNTLRPHEELEHQHTFDKVRLYNMLSRFSSQIEIISGSLRKGGNQEFLLGFARIIK